MLRKQLFSHVLSCHVEDKFERFVLDKISAYIAAAGIPYPLPLPQRDEEREGRESDKRQIFVFAQCSNAHTLHGSSGSGTGLVSDFHY